MRVVVKRQLYRCSSRTIVVHTDYMPLLCCRAPRASYDVPRARHGARDTRKVGDMMIVGGTIYVGKAQLCSFDAVVYEYGGIRVLCICMHIR